MENQDQATGQTTVSLGYIILYVADVAATLAFYEKAFGIARRFFADNDGKAYGELETGATRLAFASISLAETHLTQKITVSHPQKPPLGCEIAWVTPDVQATFNRAIAAGAVALSAPETTPWGQTVAYVRDLNGFLVELCTPLP